MVASSSSCSSPSCSADGDDEEEPTTEIINGSQIGDVSQASTVVVAFRGHPGPGGGHGGHGDLGGNDGDDEDDDGGFGAIVGGPAGSYELVNLQQLGLSLLQSCMPGTVTCK